MPNAPVNLWHGRVLALIGIILAAFSLRSAVAALSPLVSHINADFILPPTIVGLIGAAPPVCFAIFGLITPGIERRLGLEFTTVIALTGMALGMLSRGFAQDSISLLAATLLLFAGVGMGNILLPPLVKKYFPDRLSLMMTLYTLMMASASFIPPLIAVPIADATSWRISLAAWGVLAVGALLPWLVLLSKQRTEAAAAAAANGSGWAPEATTPRPKVVGRMIRTPLAWAITAAYAVSAIAGYVAFAWLPTLVREQSGIDAATAGALMATFGAASIPWALLVPVLVVRFQATRPLYVIAVVGGITGLIGYLVAPVPELMFLWTVLYGFAGGLFPLGLVLIGIRARTPGGVVVLSGMVQSIGFAAAALFPITWGIMRQVTGVWTLPILLLIAVLLFALPAGWVAGRRTTVEDEWERRHDGIWR